MWWKWLSASSSFADSNTSFPSSGLEPARLLLHPWDFPGKDTAVGCHSLLQGIFPTQGSNPELLHCRRIPYSLNHQVSLSLLQAPVTGSSGTRAGISHHHHRPQDQEESSRTPWQQKLYLHLNEKGGEGEGNPSAWTVNEITFLCKISICLLSAASARATSECCLHRKIQASEISNLEITCAIQVAALQAAGLMLGLVPLQVALLSN